MQGTLSKRPAIMTRVLIAEQDIPTRLLLRKCISAWGYEPIEALHDMPIMTILSARDNPPVLALIGYKQSTQEGLSLCQRIKTEIRPAPHLILMIPADDIHLGFRAIEAGADEVLIKPFTVAELHSRLSLAQLDSHNRLARV